MIEPRYLIRFVFAMFTVLFGALILMGNEPGESRYFVGWALVAFGVLSFIAWFFVSRNESQKAQGDSGSKSTSSGAQQ
ncbi:hypothetical protein [Ornithinimicrobium pratense]|uniref:Uncharacterized protein n=1 Tax=Ornithinimicrobium pratense TaxID=2593973 RepID=A0A5J6V387_9MICO|nr:hypothetical protein [Ornithinimicrobium pratense]QFG68185.1 hypothetical protein FY030_05165 [Ornithinimicrobium pratense]